MPSLGIIAYGSLIQCPGDELAPIIISRQSLRTPFEVEFARSSSTRCGAPTLVPVEKGGAKVDATVLELDQAVSLTDAEDRLWRRETDNVSTGKRYPRASSPGPNTVRIERCRNLAGLDVLLYTSIGANITPLTPAELATRAIQSARREAGARRKDGISYLSAALAAGIKTPLSDQYHAEILERTNAETLEESWEHVRADVAAGRPTSGCS